MRVEKIVCDYCKKEIPTEKKRDILGIEREFYKFGTLNYFGFPMKCQAIGLDLCERCAKEIDIKMEEAKLKMLTNTNNIIK